jgi:hypothetical protein
MRTNPLKNAVSQERPKLSKLELCARGNQYLREIGRAHEAEWRIENGQVVIDWIREPRTRQIPQYRQPYADDAA